MRDKAPHRSPPGIGKRRDKSVEDISLAFRADDLSSTLEVSKLTYSSVPKPLQDVTSCIEARASEEVTASMMESFDGPGGYRTLKSGLNIPMQLRAAPRQLKRWTSSIRGSQSLRHRDRRLAGLHEERGLESARQ